MIHSELVRKTAGSYYIRSNIVKDTCRVVHIASMSSVLSSPSTFSQHSQVEQKWMGRASKLSDSTMKVRCVEESESMLGSSIICFRHGDTVIISLLALAMEWIAGQKHFQNLSNPRSYLFFNVPGILKSWIRKI